MSGDCYCSSLPRPGVHSSSAGTEKAYEFEGVGDGAEAVLAGVSIHADSRVR